MSDVVRPLPEPNQITQPFWDACRQERLTYPWCEACSTAFFPPQLCCPGCLSLDWGWRESAGRGSLYSQSIVHRAPQPGFEPPYVIGVVDLDEGFELMTNIVETPRERLRIGMRVRVTWQPAGAFVLPMFVEDHQENA